MKFSKVIWVMRGFFYKLQYGHIGNISYFGKPTFTTGEKNCFIGNKVRIYPGLRMEISGGEGKLYIDDDTSIGQNFHVAVAEEDVKIGAHTTISGNVHISSLDHEYKIIDTHILKQPLKNRETVIGENCFIGYGVVILAGTNLGKQCIVGANSVVRGSFPDRCVIAGAPAKVIKKYNEQTGKWENE